MQADFEARVVPALCRRLEQPDHDDPGNVHMKRIAHSLWKTNIPCRLAIPEELGLGQSGLRVVTVLCVGYYLDGTWRFVRRVRPSSDTEAGGCGREREQ